MGSAELFVNLSLILFLCDYISCEDDAYSTGWWKTTVQENLNALRGKERCPESLASGGSCKEDDKCSFYGDCCLNHAAKVQTKAPQSPKELECSKIYSQDSQGVLMMGVCPQSKKGSQEESLCLKQVASESYSYVLDIPVISSTTNLIYKNYYCALCNDDAISLATQNISITCSTLNEMKKDRNLLDLTLEQFLNQAKYIPGTAVFKWLSTTFEPKTICKLQFGLRSLTQIADNYRARLCEIDWRITNCNSSWPEKEDFQKCRAYSYAVFDWNDYDYYQNIHCAKCNFVKIYEPYLNCKIPPQHKQAGKSVPLFLLFEVKGQLFEKCDVKKEFWDPVERKCKKIVCGKERFLVNGKCIICGEGHLMINGECVKQTTPAPVNTTPYSTTTGFSTHIINTKFKNLYNSPVVLRKDCPRIILTNFELQENGSLFSVLHNKWYFENEYEKVNDSAVWICNETVCDQNFLFIKGSCVNENTAPVTNKSFMHKPSVAETSILVNSSDDCPRTILTKFESYDNGSIFSSLHNKWYQESDYEKVNDSAVLLCVEEYLNYEYFPPLQSNTSTILLSISLICLAIQIILFASLKRLRTWHERNLICLCCSLFTAQFLFLTGTTATSNFSFCYFSSVCLHFFWLVSFFWMNVLSFDIWKTFRSQLPHSAKNKSRTFLAYNVYALGIPLLIVLSALVLDMSGAPHEFRPQYAESFYGRKLCWINGQPAVLYFFLLPVGIVILENIVLFLWTSHIIHKQAKESEFSKMKSQSFRVPTKSHRRTEEELLQEKKNKANKVTFFSYLKLGALLGITWMTGVIGSFIDSAVWWFIFTVFNSLQGAAIFFFFGLKKWVGGVHSLGEEFRKPSWTDLHRANFSSSRMDLCSFIRLKLAMIVKCKTSNLDLGPVRSYLQTLLKKQDCGPRRPNEGRYYIDNHSETISNPLRECAASTVLKDIWGKTQKRFPVLDRISRRIISFRKTKGNQKRDEKLTDHEMGNTSMDISEEIVSAPTSTLSVSES